MSTEENPSEEIGLVGAARPSSWTNHMLDWIALADKKILPDPSVRLYWLLKSFIIEDKGQEERVVQIVQEDLAEMMHRSVDSVQRALKPLYAVGLVEDRARRKVSTRVPGQDRPQVTTLLILQINEAEPPTGWTGWVKPFEARKDIRARRAAAKEAAGGTDTANLRPQSDQDGTADDADGTPPPGPADSGPREDVSAGGTDTANLPETGADLLQNGADLRCIGSNLSGSNLSGEETSCRQEPTRDDIDALCSRLCERVTTNGVKATITEKWRTNARLLLDRDGRELGQALRLIDWATSNSFWSANVLSMPTFRKHYDRLLLQARREHEQARRQQQPTVSQTDANIAAFLGQGTGTDGPGFLALPGGNA